MKHDYLDEFNNRVDICKDKFPSSFNAIYFGWIRVEEEAKNVRVQWSDINSWLDILSNYL